jgi:hypothetical protein
MRNARNVAATWLPAARKKVVRIKIAAMLQKIKLVMPRVFYS